MVDIEHARKKHQSDETGEMLTAALVIEWDAKLLAGRHSRRSAKAKVLTASICVNTLTPEHNVSSSAHASPC